MATNKVMAEPYETFGLFRAIIRINYKNYSSLDQEKALNKDLAYFVPPMLLLTEQRLDGSRCKPQ
jgi:hypothetical protein